MHGLTTTSEIVLDVSVLPPLAVTLNVTGNDPTVIVDNLNSRQYDEVLGDEHPS